MKKIAIVGGGIVGSSAAFYLAKNGYIVHLFDDGIGQATSAAAGIICPWVSQRRHKHWYRLCCEGAAFYHQLLKDLSHCHLSTDFYRANGALLFKKNSLLLDKLYQLAKERLKDNPAMKSVQYMKYNEHHIPELLHQNDAIYIEGAAMVDGKQLIDTLRQGASMFNFTFTQEKVSLENIIHKFEYVILATGAWTGEILQPLGYESDISQQKGQLLTVELANKENQNYPVIIAQGEYDILPLHNGEWLIGASHEKDKGFDLTPDPYILNYMQMQTYAYVPEMTYQPIKSIRVGTRAYTSDFAPFFGFLPETDNVLVASGLGASGLTSGAYIGFLLSELVQEKEIPLDLANYSPANYITKTS